MSTAIERSELRDLDERSAQEARILLEIAQAAGSTLDLGEVLSRVVERTASLTGADRCSIWLLDRTREWLLPAALYGMDPGFTAQWKRSVLNVREERLSQEVIATGRPVVVLDASSDPRTDKNAVAMFSDKSILVVPLMNKGRVIGTLFTNHIEQRYAFTDQDVAVTLAIASQAAAAIENAQLYEESRRRSEELFDSFRRIGDALTAGLDLFETLQIIVNLATDMVYASVGCLELLGADGALLVEATRGIALAECQARVAERGDSLGQEVVETRRPLNVSDLQLLAKRYPHNPFGDVSGSYLGLPLRRRGELLGVLAVYDRHAGRFTNSEIDLLHSFANQAAVAIDNAQLFAATQQQVADLSAAKAQNAALIDSLGAERNRLNAIIQNSSDAIYMVDSTFRIIAFNPAAERLTGWTAAEAVGARCDQIFGCNHSIVPRDGESLAPMLPHAPRVRDARADTLRRADDHDPRRAAARSCRELLLRPGDGELRAVRRRDRARHQPDQGGRTAQVRVRLDGLARLAHSAGRHQGLRGDAPQPEPQAGRGPQASLHHRDQRRLGQADQDHRQPALGLAPRVGAVQAHAPAVRP